MTTPRLYGATSLPRYRSYNTRSTTRLPRHTGGFPSGRVVCSGISLQLRQRNVARDGLGCTSAFELLRSASTAYTASSAFCRKAEPFTTCETDRRPDNQMQPTVYMAIEMGLPYECCDGIRQAQRVRVWFISDRTNSPTTSKTTILYLGAPTNPRDTAVESLKNRNPV